MTNKTPFELRYDLLSLSQGILVDKVFAERNRLENDWSVACELARVENKPIPSYPSLPSVEPDDIIELAKKLNEFVSNNNSGDNKNA